MKQIKTSRPKNNKGILKNLYSAIIELIKRIKTNMKTSIYDQFQFGDKLTTNSNMHTKIIKGTKNKPKIKR